MAANLLFRGVMCPRLPLYRSPHPVFPRLSPRTVCWPPPAGYQPFSKVTGGQLVRNVTNCQAVRSATECQPIRNASSCQSVKKAIDYQPVRKVTGCQLVRKAAGCQPSRHFSSSSHLCLRGRNPTYRYRRRTPQHSVVLLERFIKQTNLDGSLVAKAPFHLCCYGSHFDENNDVNIAKNRQAEEERDEFYREEKLRRREEIGSRLEESIAEREEEEKQAFQELSSEREDGAGIFVQSPGDVASAREIGEVERRILDQLSGTSTTQIIEGINNRTRSPLHFKIFGKPHLRVDSYSILRGKAHASHIYISDAGSTEEAVKLLSENGGGGSSSFSPSGSISIWRPRQVSEVEITENPPSWSHEEEEVVSALKIYTPHHVIEDPESCLKASFLCPMLMNKIFLETEKSANIELNGKLFDQLVSVGLYTEYGTVHVRDVWAHDIKLASRYGDIVCDGTMEGDITAETSADGDFISRITVGQKLKVTTDSGDISLWGDCFADQAELYTVSGHVHLRYLYGCAKILVKEQGSVSINVVEGSVAAVVKSGSIFAHINKLSEDSFLEVESGDVTLTLHKNFPYRLSLEATTTNIVSSVLNSGEFFLSGNGQESFVSSVISGPGEYQPSLSVRCHHGQINLQVSTKSTDEEKRSPQGFDSS